VVLMHCDNRRSIIVLW